MADSSLASEHQRYTRTESVRLGGVPMELEWVAYGIADAPPAAELPQIVATYGLLELEYSAFRRSAAVMDRADRGTLVVEGGARIEFLNRMVTQELKGMAAGQVRRAFWLNRKGRIQADLLLCEFGACELPSCGEQPARMLVDLDVHDVKEAASSLEAFVFSEDVRLVAATAQWSRLSVHGPSAVAVLQRAATCGEELFEPLHADMACVVVELVGAPVWVARADTCGTVGLELWVPTEHAARVYASLVDQHSAEEGGRRVVRPAGWQAYNIARIEAGTPLFHVDFGPSNLPHETGVLAQRVSFKKGCYLGQEVVARMESLGKPKQVLVALRPAQDLLPTAGSPVFERSADGEPGSPVGTVTSSTLSPLLGAQPVAFAMLRTAQAEPGTLLVVPAEGGRTDATVQPTLAFVRPEGAAAP